MNAPAHPLIRFSNVTKHFRRTPVLDDINLDIGTGERIALIGANGAGKTTLIRCLLGEYTHKGTITVNGLNLHHDRTAILNTIGFVPQLPPPLKMPVGQLIHFSAALCNTPPQQIYTIARHLGLDLDDILSRQFVRLSGGMKQKLLIAIALGRNTRILIMDEPAANLDPDARRIFFDMLAERIGEVTLILSSHRLDEVSALVSRVIEMDRGKIILDDTLATGNNLSDTLDCRIIIKRSDPAFSNAMKLWGFTCQEEIGVWKSCGTTSPVCHEETAIWFGQIAGPDRLRFLGMIARYTALISDLSLTDGNVHEPE